MRAYPCAREIPAVDLYPLLTRSHAPCYTRTLSQPPGRTHRKYWLRERDLWRLRPRPPEERLRIEIERWVASDTPRPLTSWPARYLEDEAVSLHALHASSCVDVDASDGACPSARQGSVASEMKGGGGAAATVTTTATEEGGVEKEEEEGSDSGAEELGSWGGKGGWGEEEWLEEEEESVWELAEDSGEERGWGWQQFWKRRGGWLGVEEAVCALQLVHACCHHVSMCLADTTPPSPLHQGLTLQSSLWGVLKGGGGEGGSGGVGPRQRGMGNMRCMCMMGWGWCRGCRNCVVKERGGGGGGGEGCNVGDHVRRLEAMALCLERLCFYPALEVVLSAVRCVGGEEQ
jgi:hypothetical protein